MIRLLHKASYQAEWYVYGMLPVRLIFCRIGSDCVVKTLHSMF